MFKFLRFFKRKPKQNSPFWEFENKLKHMIKHHKKYSKLKRIKSFLD